jgi:hypothetical protein
MNASHQTRLTPLPAPPLREYYSRVLAYIAVAATIAAGTYVQHFGYDILWMVPYALLYPHLAHHLSLRFKRDHPQKTTLALLFMDSLHCGAALALLGFSVVPSRVCLLILACSSLVIGGLRHLALALLIALCSALLNATLIACDCTPDTPAVVALGSIAFATW